MFQYAIEKSYDEMCSVIELAKEDLNNGELKKEVNFRIGTFLHWLLDYFARIEISHKIDKEDISFFSGLKYANNKLKHDPQITIIYERTGGFEFPISFPFSSEIISFKWNSIAEEIDPKRRNQYLNYEKYIRGKEVIEMSKTALEILSKYTYVKASHK